MYTRPTFVYVVIVAVCLTGTALCASGALAQNLAAKKQPATSASAKSGKAAPAKKPAKRNPEDPARLKEDLDHFARDCITRMNRQRRPGISHKEVERLPDGSYLARYMAVDPDSLATSYDPVTGNKTVKYIGRMEYHEVEYVCNGKDQKQALAGPFYEANRVPIIELIKFKLGKWSY